MGRRPIGARRRPLATAALFLFSAGSLASCGWIGDDGPLRVAVIGALDSAVPIPGAPVSDAQAALVSARAQGLVALDAMGRVDVGLADRWTVTGDGLSYIFRLRDARWSDGRPVVARDVADSLSRAFRPNSAVRGLLDLPADVTVKAMTARVVEIRLRRPDRHLLDMLAQPELALTRDRRGWGPMGVRREGGTWLLRDVPADPVEPDIESEEAVAQEDAVALVVRPALGSVQRFRNNEVDAVLGGRFQHWPLIGAAGVAPARVVVDRAPGLFGLTFVHDDGFLADARRREAVSMALRREAMTEAFAGAEWPAEASLRPRYTAHRDAPPPLYPAWIDLAPADRRAQAAGIVAAWRAESASGAAPVLRIALPEGTGARILFAYLRTDLARVGIEARRVAMRAPADLRLVDAVAPSTDPAWPVWRVACRRGALCSEVAQQRLSAARAAPDAEDARRLLGEAEEALIRDAVFVPLASPLRWSLASPRARGIVPNERAAHPLNHLAAPPK